MQIEVSYMSGAGNLFSVIDNRKYMFSDDNAIHLASILCTLNDINSFRTEGLMLVENPIDDYSDFNVRFFNPDGSSGMMCGNGGRVAIKFAAIKKFIKGTLLFETYFTMAKRNYKGIIQKDTIVLFLPGPKKIQNNIHISTRKFHVACDYVDVATDHCVINYKNIQDQTKIEFDAFDVNANSSEVRFHPQFNPKGANVNYFEIIDNETIKLRTFERGVECETGACGTGAVSTAIIAVMNNNMQFPITIIPTSGSPLIVDVIGRFPNEIEAVILQGGADLIEEKIVEVEENMIFQNENK